MADSRLFRLAGLVAVTAVLGTSAVLAEVPYEPKTEVGFLVGAGLPDRNIVGEPDGYGDVGPVVGVRGAHRFGSFLNWFGDATASWHGDVNFSSGNAELVDLRTGIELFTSSQPKYRWFVAGAAGWSWVDYENDAFDFDRPLVSAGVGQRWLTDRLGFMRWELRVNRPVQNDGLNGADIANAQWLFGWALPIGGPPPDSDADGVPDKTDRCPGTPHMAIVDANGCPTDSDGDGVYDGLDRCPNTPRGAKVDGGGCPLDEDGDGVFDGLDRCPGTPRGARVDSNGCPTDGDGDGVFDGLDRCPDTPRGVKVDASGCPVDSDGDGVLDGVDRCPDTPRGTQVDAQGCPNAPPKVESPFIPAPKKPVVLEGVTFATDSAALTDASKGILDQVAAGLKDNPDVRVEVAGHTDSSGSDKHNQALSQWRAESVRDYLVRMGVPAAQVQARGYGESQPVAENTTAGGKAKNRRVELRRL